MRKILKIHMFVLFETHMQCFLDILMELQLAMVDYMLTNINFELCWDAINLTSVYVVEETLTDLVNEN